MRYVIIRDDDTNAFTPVECLERLYRPFLKRGLPVNLAVIPSVATDAKMSDGRPEGFLLKVGQASRLPRMEETGPSGDTRDACPTFSNAVLESPATPRDSDSARTVPIATNSDLVRYLLDNPGYHVVQHGCHHDYLEFDSDSRPAMAQRLAQGTDLLMAAGFPRPETFVAPYDRLSRASLLEVRQRFRVLSTGWYELRRLPYSWWPNYALKKLSRAPHWRVGRTLLLSHPGCLLSCHRTYSTMLGGILHYLENNQLTVLVTHWWEYFRDGKPDTALIEFLHETAAYIATHPNLKALSFADLLKPDARKAV